MKRIAVALLCMILSVNLLSGCGQSKNVEAGELPKDQVVTNQPQDAGEEGTEPIEQEDNQEETVTEEDDYTKDLTMTSVKGSSGEISYTSVENIPLEKGGHIAVVVKQPKSEYWSKVRKGMEAAVKALNKELGYKGEDKIRLTFEGPSDESDVESQINIIDAVLSENPSVLCIAAVDMNSCQAQLETAAENGIPVVVLDSGVNSDLVQTVCSTDNYQAGAEAARRLAEAVGESGKVAVMAHNSSSESSMDREKGFREEIANHQGITVVSTSYESEEESVREMVSAVLEAHPDLTGYFCTNGTMTEELLSALKDREEVQVKVVGFDSGKAQIEAIKDGRETGMIVQNPYGMGYATIVAAARAEAGMTNDTYISSGFQWIDVNNLESDDFANYLYE